MKFVCNWLLRSHAPRLLNTRYVAVCCSSVVQCVAAACCSVSQNMLVCGYALQRVEVRVQLAAAVSRAEAAEHKVCCSVLQQRAAVCCSSVLQCVAVCRRIC